MDMSKYRDMFLFETREHLLSMGDLLVALEKNPADEERLDALFRHAHSIKGMAGAMGYQRTAELGHHLEDYLHGFRSSGSLPREAFDRLLAGVDLLEQLVEDIAAERPEREVAAYLSGIAAVPEEAAVPASGRMWPGFPVARSKSSRSGANCASRRCGCAPVCWIS
ncbi:MAG: Hpt domain-containing protein [Desulfuromonadaceae bacterium]